MWRDWLAVCAVLLCGGCAVLGPATPEPKVTAAMVQRHVVSDFIAPVTTETSRRDALARADEAIAAARNLLHPSGLAPDPEQLLPKALWAVSFFNRAADRDVGRQLVLAAVPSLAQQTPAYQRAVLSVAHQLYAADSQVAMRALLPQLQTPREFAIAAYTLLRAQGDAPQRQWIGEQLTLRFGAITDEPRLVALRRHLGGPASTSPPLAELLAAPFRPGVPVIFSIQRPGRQVMGLVLVRGADGKFVRGDDGRVFAQPQLARALSELPGTITNGQTPQGVFSIVGLGVAKNQWIGPTPYLHSKLPFEATVEEFAHAPAVTSATWALTDYLGYLPASWQNHLPMQEAWLAGMAGRDEIILHGTTIDSAQYSGASYHPGTPSAGCLVSVESWDASTGLLRTSDQLSLAKAFTRDGHDKGYLVVVEIAESAEPVRLDELLPLLP